MYETPFHEPENIGNYSFLVTGGAGFIGSNIVEYLMKYGAQKVRVLDDLSTGCFKNIEPYINNPSFEFMEGDIRKQKDCIRACKNIDYVSHQAALGSVPRSINNPVLTHDVNSTGFLNMLVAARDEGVKKFVYASSSSVYGDSPALPKIESQIGNPLSPYAVSKRTNELYARVFAETYKMNITGLRYFNVFGPRQSPQGPYAAAIPLFIDAAINNREALIYGDGEQTRDFTFVENAVQANILSFFVSNNNGNILNIAVGERVSINALLDSIKLFSSTDLMPSYIADRAGDVRNSLADISLAKEQIGYNPRIKFKQGLELTYHWFKNNLLTKY